MLPPCKYARPGGRTAMAVNVPGNRMWARCTIGDRHPDIGDTPAYGVCMRQCPDYVGPERTPKLIAQVCENEVKLTVSVRHSWWWRRYLPRKGLVIPYRTGRAGSCKNATPIYRWLGMKWFGWPWPLRWRVCWPVRMERVTAQQIRPRVRPPLHVKSMPGCGCMEWAKQLATHMKHWWRYTYNLQ